MQAIWKFRPALRSMATDAQAEPCVVIAASRFNNPEKEIPDVKVFPTPDRARRRYPITD